MPAWSLKYCTAPARSFQDPCCSATAMATQADFWQIIFSVLGPFDIYGTGGGDPLLRSRRELVVQICQLVDFPENLEVSVAAMHALADMAESPVFAASSAHSPHKLYSILEAAGELPAIMESFIRRLEREETEQVSLLSEGGQTAMERVQNEEGFAAAFGLANLVRLQIIDFLIRNAAKSGYNLAHYLLGFRPNEILAGAAGTIAPANGEGVTFNSFYMVLELLAYGLGRPSTPIIALDHASLGHKCYELLRVLLSNVSTQRCVAAYLRDHEDFYRQQLKHVSKELVDPADIGFTVYEMLQKAELLEGAALDLHLALADSSWTYAKGLFSILCFLSDAEEGEPKLAAGTSVVSLVVGSALEQVLSPGFLGSLSDAIREELLLAATCLLRAATRLTQLLVLATDRMPYDAKSLRKLQGQLVTSLIPILARLLQNPLAAPEILENIGAGSLAIVSFFETQGSEQQMAGDELASLLMASLMALTRSDLSIAARGYLYAVLSQASATLTKDESLNTLIKRDLARIADVVAHDAILPAVDVPAMAWKTIATAFLNVLLKVGSDDPQLITERLVRSGFLKALVTSLRTDDRFLSDSSFSAIILLWRSKFALLERLAAATPTGGERLIELGLIDSLVSLHFLETAPSSQRCFLILQPLLRLLRLLSLSAAMIVKRMISLLVVTLSNLFDRILRQKTLVGSSEEGLSCLSLALGILADTVADIHQQHPQQQRRSWHRTLTDVVIKVAAALSEDPSSRPFLEILANSFVIFRQEMSLDSNLGLIAFAEDPFDLAARAGLIPLSLIARVLEVCATLDNDLIPGNL